MEANGARWFILSARYGLVAPDQVIDPYDLTLNSMKVADRKAWAMRVLQQLRGKSLSEKRVVLFAGRRYHEFLVEPLQQQGLKVELPMQHLRLGEQLSWLSRHAITPGAAIFR